MLEEREKIEKAQTTLPGLIGLLPHMIKATRDKIAVGTHSHLAEGYVECAEREHKKLTGFINSKATITGIHQLNMHADITGAYEYLIEAWGLHEQANSVAAKPQNDHTRVEPQDPQE